MTIAISGSAFLTAAETLESSWLIIRAISRALLVSRPREAAFWLSVVRVERSRTPRLGAAFSGCSEGTCSIMERVAIGSFHEYFLIVAPHGAGCTINGLRSQKSL